MTLLFKRTDFLKYLMILVGVMFFQSPSSAAVAASNDIAIKFLIDAKGSCKSETVNLSLNNVYFLKDKSLIEPIVDGYKILEINGDNFDVAYYSKDGKFKQLKFDNIALDVAANNKNNSDVDIEASFVLLDGQVAVYWKETFINRPYKHGIFKVDNDKLVFYCEGKGGIYKSH